MLRNTRNTGKKILTEKIERDEIKRMEGMDGKQITCINCEGCKRKMKHAYDSF
jgi:hypothetical protein